MTPSRKRDVLNHLYDTANDHALTHTQREFAHDAARAINAADAAEQAAWFAGLDEGRAQARHNDAIAAGRSP